MHGLVPLKNGPWLMTATRGVNEEMDMAQVLRQQCLKLTFSFGNTYISFLSCQHVIATLALRNPLL